jgi:uncharacterized protein YbjT (DUF2867 family)
MKVILFGATGMIGQGVLRECLLDPGVERVLAVTRAPLPQRHEKLSELIHQDFTSYDAVAGELAGYDACFFCLGVSSVGMSEEAYHHVTYDFAVAAAETLVKQSPQMTFVFVSGMGSDSTEQGRSMWARVKGKTENALLRLPFKATYVFRPGVVQPLHGIKSKARLNRTAYAIARPLFPLLKVMAPKSVTTTERVGRAMLAIARQGAPKKILDNQDINELRG